MIRIRITAVHSWIAITVGPFALFCLGLPNARAENTMRYVDRSGTARVNEPVQFGRVFLKGEIINYPQVLVNGSAVTTQANVMSRWKDGSVKHAVISFLLPNLGANGAAIFSFQNQTGCNCGAAARLTKSQMLDSPYDFDATVTVGTTTISARTILNAWDGAEKGTSALPAFWADGSLSTTVIMGDHSSNAAYDITVNGHASLRPIFIATFWPTINKVRVRFVLENSNTLQLQNLTYNAILKTGSASPATVYNSTSTWASGIPHIAATRWTKMFWIGGSPDDQYNLDHNLAYMASTATVPNYDTAKTISLTQIASDYSAWTAGTKDIYQNHGANAYTWDSAMGDTGGRPDIGTFPAWYVRWLYTGDYRERQIMLGNADLASSFPVQIREGATGKFFDIAGTVPAIGRVLSIAARPTVDFSQSWSQPSATAGDRITPVGTATGFASGTWQWDSAHIPSAFFLPYITTGDFFYLEQMRFWCAFSAAYPVASTVDNYGRGASLKSGVVYQGQTRAEAWGMRERAEAAWMEPDGTPEQALFNQWMASNIAILDGMHNLTSSQYNGNADWNWGRTVRAANTRETYNGSRTYPLYHSSVSFPAWWYGVPGSSGFCDPGYGIDDTVCNSGLQTFELSYLAYALGRSYELGYPTDKLIASVVGPWYVAVLTDPGYNPYLIQAGEAPTQKKPATDFTSMADLLTGYWADQPTAVSHGATVWRSKSSLPLSDAQNGYDILGSAAVAMTANLTSGGAAAWTWVQTHIESSSVYNNNPTWAILARTLASAKAPPSCDQNGDGRVNIVDIQLTISQVLGTLACTSGDLDQSGTCSIIDVQRVINAALGSACIVGP